VYVTIEKLIGMLSTLLSDTLSVPRKKQVLESEYGLPMTREMEKEAHIMCNISAGIAAEKDVVIKEKDVVIKEKDVVIKEKDTVIEEQQAVLEQQRAELEKARAEIAALKAQLQEKGN
jgi:hypothetical protein